MLWHTALTQRLGFDHPIIQAPLAGGGDTPALVAAVCEAGALGCIGAAYLPPAQIVEAARAVRARTARPFGINLFAPLPAPALVPEPGPALAGFLIATLGTASCYVVQVGFYLVAIVWTLRLRPPPSAATRGRAAPGASFGQSIVEGWTFSWRNAAVRTGLLITMCASLFIMPFTTLLPVFARDLLGVGATGQGRLLTAMGIGAVGSAVLVASLGDRLPRGLLMLGSVTLYGLSVVAFATSSSFRLMSHGVMYGVMSRAMRPFPGLLSAAMYQEVLRRCGFEPRHGLSVLEMMSHAMRQLSEPFGDRLSVRRLMVSSLPATLIATASLRRKPPCGYVYCGRLSAQRDACFLLRLSCAGHIADASTKKSGYEAHHARPTVGKGCEAAMETAALINQLGVRHRVTVAYRTLFGMGFAAVPAAREGLRYANADVRYHCLRLLDHFLVPEALSELIGMLRDPDPRVRRSALHTLACDRCKEEACRPGEAEVLPEALRMLHADGNRHVRAMAIEAVGQYVHTNPMAERALVEARTNDPSPAVRKKAGWYAPGGPIHTRTAPRPARKARRR